MAKRVDLEDDRVELGDITAIADRISVGKESMLVTYAIIEILLPDSYLHSTFDAYLKHEITEVGLLNKLHSVYSDLRNNHSITALFDGIKKQIAEYATMLRTKKVEMTTSHSGEEKLDYDRNLLSDVENIPSVTLKLLELKRQISADVAREHATFDAIQKLEAERKRDGQDKFSGSAIERIIDRDLRRKDF